MLKSIEQIGEEIRQRRENKELDIKERMMKKYDLTEEQYETAVDYSY